LAFIFYFLIKVVFTNRILLFLIEGAFLNMALFFSFLIAVVLKSIWLHFFFF